MGFSNKPNQQIKANLVWFTLCPSLQESVVADLTCVLLEVISNASLGSFNHQPFIQKSSDLHPSVYPPTGHFKPGKPASAVCSQAARP
jgi:hypothetical protein